MQGLNNRDMMRLTGLSSRMVSFLSESGLVKAELREASGNGSSRRYSQWDGVKALLYVHLRKLGMSTRKMRPIFRSLQRFHQHFQSSAYHLNIVDNTYAYITSQGTNAGYPLTDAINLKNNRWVPMDKLTRVYEVRLEINIAKLVERTQTHGPVETKPH